jgi:hypothetical protein
MIIPIAQADPKGAPRWRFADRANSSIIEARPVADPKQKPSDDDLGKKLVEEEQLLQVLEAYETVTGERLSILNRGAKFCALHFRPFQRNASR